jgi:hypothetical protein
MPTLTLLTHDGPAAASPTSGKHAVSGAVPMNAERWAGALAHPVRKTTPASATTVNL